VKTLILSPTWPQQTTPLIVACKNTTDLAHIEDNLAAMTPFGATYGQYTRNALTAPGVSGNPILNGAKAWYWIEAFRYAEVVNSGTSIGANLIPEPSSPFVYRITAVAQGMKGGTQAVIKSVFVPNPANQIK
jgi:type IV pilus assembly protein PilX